MIDPDELGKWQPGEVLLLPAPAILAAAAIVILLAVLVAALFPALRMAVGCGSAGVIAGVVGYLLYAVCLLKPIRE